VSNVCLRICLNRVKCHHLYLIFASISTIFEFTVLKNCFIFIQDLHHLRPICAFPKSDNLKKYIFSIYCIFCTSAHGTVSSKTGTRPEADKELRKCRIRTGNFCIAVRYVTTKPATSPSPISCITCARYLR
jgi:hypothetical protein